MQAKTGCLEMKRKNNPKKKNGEINEKDFT